MVLFAKIGACYAKLKDRYCQVLLRGWLVDNGVFILRPVGRTQPENLVAKFLCYFLCTRVSKLGSESKQAGQLRIKVILK